MERTSFENWNCSVARTLDLIGDLWSLLIIREVYFGTRTFNEFQHHLGLSKNILSRRLKKMQADGLMERRAALGDARSHEYHLTEKGRSLLTVVIAMMQWGDQWADDQKGPPILVKERNTGKLIAPVKVTDGKGNSLEMRDLTLSAGPGADAVTRSRLESD